MAAASREPPAVCYPYAPTRLLAAVAIALLALSALLLTAWLLTQNADGLQAAAAAVVWSASAGLNWRWWRDLPSGELAWINGAWSLRVQGQDPVPCHALRVCVDLQHVLCVRVRHAKGSVHWLWLARSLRPAQWLDLRRALLARERQAAGPGTPRGWEAAS